MARVWLSQGYRVHGVTRAADKAKRLEDEGLTAHLCDIRTTVDLPWQDSPDAVLWSVGFDHAVGEAIDRVQEGGVRHVLASLKRKQVKPRVWIQISTTGVYGDCEGEWVTEQTPARPNREGGRAALEAELLVSESEWVHNSVVLRLAGIYGPGRVPNLESLRKKEPIGADPTGWLNLIHVDDVVRAIDLAASVALPESHSTFVVSDGQPVLRMQYYRFAANQFGLPAPIFEPPAVGSAKAARGMGSKRVDSRRFWETYGSEPIHPNYESGLAASL